MRREGTWVRSRSLLQTGAGFLRDLTSHVDAVVDDELTVSQIVEDGLKVLGAAVDEVRPVFVPLVPPHIWSDNKSAQLKQKNPNGAALFDRRLPFSRNM